MSIIISEEDRQWILEQFLVDGDKRCYIDAEGLNTVLKLLEHGSAKVTKESIDAAQCSS